MGSLSLLLKTHPSYGVSGPRFPGSRLPQADFGEAWLAGGEEGGADMGGTTQASKYSRIWTHSPFPTLQAPHSFSVYMRINQPAHPPSFLVPGSGILDHQLLSSFQTIHILAAEEVI